MINSKQRKNIEELISNGWQFWISYAPMDLNPNNKFGWEADFTRYIPSTGLYDNHETGIHETDPNKAIEIAYNNIINGNKLK